MSRYISWYLIKNEKHFRAVVYCGSKKYKYSIKLSISWEWENSRNVPSVELKPQSKTGFKEFH